MKASSTPERSSRKAIPRDAGRHPSYPRPARCSSPSTPLIPSRAKIRRAVDALLRAGGVIAYPTDTVYGIGCDLTNKHAIDRLYTIKRMERSHPLAFVCPDLSDIARYAMVDNQVYRVLRRFFPGPYTFVLPATREVPRLVQMPRKTVGIRVPACEVTRALARELGRPIVSSTAARPGEPALVDPREIDQAFQRVGARAGRRRRRHGADHGHRSDDDSADNRSRRRRLCV